MVVYFSGTGNSRYCAKKLACALDDALLDSADYLKHQIAAELISDKPWVFVCPIHAWQMPRVFEDFLRSGAFAGSEDAYFVFTCGSEIGCAALRAEALCKEKGLNYKGTLEVVMPDNYIVMFKAPDADQCARIIEAAQPELERAIDVIRAGETLPEKKTGALDRFKSKVINKGFCQMPVKSKGFYVTDACIGCGKCAARCPLGNIGMQEGRPAWGERCTQCMSCINGCPKTAIEYGKRTAGKRRYQCPEYREQK